MFSPEKTGLNHPNFPTVIHRYGGRIPKEMIARNGHEWLRLPGRKGLLAKVVTRQEFRADTEDGESWDVKGWIGMGRTELGEFFFFVFGDIT